MNYVSGAESLVGVVIARLFSFEISELPHNNILLTNVCSSHFHSFVIYYSPFLCIYMYLSMSYMRFITFTHEPEAKPLSRLAPSRMLFVFNAKSMLIALTCVHLFHSNTSTVIVFAFLDQDRRRNAIAV